MANVATVAMPLQLYNGKFNSPLDAREKLVITGDSPTLADFETVREPYIHMRIHVHKADTNTESIITTNCLGVYEVDSLKEVSVLGAKQLKIDTYHQVYSCASGLYSEYEPEGKDKNVIYFCTDTDGDHAGKIYFNDSPYGGGQASYDVDTANNLLIIPYDDKEYGCSLVLLSTPKNVACNANGTNTSASRTVSFTSDSTSTDIFEYRIKNNGNWGSWITSPTKSVVLQADISVETTIVEVQCRATRNGRSSISEVLSVTLTRHVPTPVIAYVGSPATDQYSKNRTIDISITGLDGCTIFYTTDGSNPINSQTKQTYNPSTKIAVTGTDNGKTLKVVASKSGWQPSEISTLEIKVGVLPMWWGLIAENGSAPSTDSAVEALTIIKATTVPQSTGVISTSGQKKVVICTPSTLADLTSIKDANGTEYKNQFTKTTTTSYKVYTMNGAAEQSSMNYTFK